MTALSVNVNKLALLRNSRGHDYPSLEHFATRFLELGVQGITVHPRPDERHVKFADLPALAGIVKNFPGCEFNVEGFPSDDFLQRVIDCQAHQCTLVPDAADQLTSDHGWNLHQHGQWLQPRIARLQEKNIRVSLFLDPDPQQIKLAAGTGAERIELYTESYAEAFASSQQAHITEQFCLTAQAAQAAGLGVNAGHDLNLQNLPQFLAIKGVLEVSIGHALMVECIEQGMEHVIRQYLRICAAY
ncbi:MAG: pyridoxine 5'-phosphate synthase [Gammaproteobacteria bacterium]|jgi:pyridoxine 5-phosphate synthase